MSTAQYPSNLFVISSAHEEASAQVAPESPDSYVPRTLPSLVEFPTYAKDDTALYKTSLDMKKSQSLKMTSAALEKAPLPDESNPPKLMLEQESLTDILTARHSPATASDPSGRPTIPYATLITRAIESAPDQKITLNGIYTFAMTHYPYFRTASTGWKNSIRHNLSLNKNFVRVPRPANERGKGAYWTLAPNAKTSRSRTRSSSEPPRFGSSETLHSLKGQTMSSNVSATAARSRFDATPYARPSNTSRVQSQDSLFSLSEGPSGRHSANALHPAVASLRPHGRGFSDPNHSSYSDLEASSSFSISTHSLESDSHVPLSAISGDLARQFADTISLYQTENGLYSSQPLAFFPAQLDGPLSAPPLSAGPLSAAPVSSDIYGPHSAPLLNDIQNVQTIGTFIDGDDSLVFPYSGLVPYGDQYATYEGSTTSLPWMSVPQDNIVGFPDNSFYAEMINTSAFDSSPDILAHSAVEYSGAGLKNGATPGNKGTFQLSEGEQAMIVQAAVEAVWDPTLQGFYDHSGATVKWDDLQ